MNLTATAENGRARIELKGTISKWRETEAEFTSKVDSISATFPHAPPLT